MPEFMSLLVSLFIPLHQTVRFSFLSSAPSDSFKNLTVFSLLEDASDKIPNFADGRFGVHQ